MTSRTGAATLTPSGYRPRVADAQIAARLNSAGAVLIEGPKGCGKTWAALRHARSVVHLDGDAMARRLVGVSPEAVLEGESPRLIDEWQLAPQIWNHVRHACDRSGQHGRFLLTGSAAPTDDITRHSSAGRVARTRLRPMSLLESGMSSGEVSLGSILSGASVVVAAGDWTLADMSRVWTPSLRGRSFSRSRRNAPLQLRSGMLATTRSQISRQRQATQ